MSDRQVVEVHRGEAVSDGAGVRLTRVIGRAGLDRIDPFLLLDEFRSDRPDDYLAGFPDHPHRGFETVTYMLAGTMEHRDHAGNHGLLKPGGAQWMTAGRGIIHSEMPRQEEGLLWGFQLWVNLPAALKMTAPRYQDIDPLDVPEIRRHDGVLVRVVAGESGGLKGAVSGIATEPLYLDVALPPGVPFTQEVAAGHSGFVYVFEGAVRCGGAEGQPGTGQALARGELGVLGPGQRVRLEAEGVAARLLLVAARPLHEPVARYGPFVMNTREEIEQAVADFRRGTFLG